MSDTAIGVALSLATIREGGSDFTPGWAIVYVAITTVGSVANWRWLHARIDGSDLLDAETTAGASARCAAPTWWWVSA